jgi:hypothetical protein
MNEAEATYRQAQMEYTHMVRGCAQACDPSVPVMTQVAARRQLEAASDALADAVAALVRAGK